MPEFSPPLSLSLSIPPRSIDRFIDAKMKQKRVGIVGAGISGLAACKHVVEKGFQPVVFEAEASVGGVWARTIYSTKLQTPNFNYQFTDFPWPPEHAADVFPRNDKVLEYLESYARHFDLLRWIRFKTKVVGIEYVGATEQKMAEWELWSGNGEAFGDAAGGEWHVSVQHVADGSSEVYKVDFLILCIGKYSGVPNIPGYAENEGPEVFNGQVIHSMEYSNLDKASALNMIKGKRITLIGSGKTAYDIAAECAIENGTEKPCTMICRRKRWVLEESSFLGLTLYLYFYTTRFSELLVHKPGEGFLQNLLISFCLSPVRWVLSKVMEMCCKQKTPLKKHGMVPEHSFFKEMSTCSIAIMTEKFYENVQEGSIILKKSKNTSFCKKGVLIGEGDELVESDLVIFATGFNGDEKLRSIFKSSLFQKIVLDPPNTTTLYRQCIHPRIPQLAIIGHAESVANLHTYEMLSKWISCLLDGNFRVPSIRSMEKDVMEWQKHLKQHKHENGVCFGVTTIWLNDLLCKDIGLNPKRKKGFLAEWFFPYGPSDYNSNLPKQE